jgi:hypothetical protein
MQERSKENADIIEEFAKERERIIQRVFGNSDSIFAQSWGIHDIFMIGYGEAFAKAFEDSFAKGFNQESIENLEPEALKQRESERHLQALRYLLPYCASLRFPALVSLALEQTQRQDSPDMLRAMLNKLLIATLDTEARYALIMEDIFRGTSISQDIIKEGLKEGLEDGEKRGLGEALLQTVEIRFPILLTQAKLVIEQGTSVEQLRMLFNKLCQANTIEEAQTALLSNG